MKKNGKASRGGMEKGGEKLGRMGSTSLTPNQNSWLRRLRCGWLVYTWTTVRSNAARRLRTARQGEVCYLWLPCCGQTLICIIALMCMRVGRRVWWTAWPTSWRSSAERRLRTNCKDWHHCWSTRPRVHTEVRQGRRKLFENGEASGVYQWQRVGRRISHYFRKEEGHFSCQEMIVYASTRIPRQQEERERIFWGGVLPVHLGGLDATGWGTLFLSLCLCAWLCL